MENADILKGNVISFKKDVSMDLVGEGSQEFLVDTLSNASTLIKLNPIYRKSPAGDIDTLGVEGRRLRKHGRTHTPNNTTDGITKSKIPYAVQKVFWDTWLDDDDVWYNEQTRHQNIEDVIMSMIQSQAGIDLQDLIFNGDTETEASDSDFEFLSIIDGFVKKMKKSSFKTDLGTAEPKLIDFSNHIQILPERYKNAHDDITWFITRNTHDKLTAQITQRQTGFGDAVLVDGKLERFGGYPVEIVTNLQSGFAALTPMKNLKPVFTREIRYKRTAEGAEAASKDATYHILFAYLDCVLREVDAVAYLVGEKL